MCCETELALAELGQHSSSCQITFDLYRATLSPIRIIFNIRGARLFFFHDYVFLPTPVIKQPYISLRLAIIARIQIVFVILSFSSPCALSVRSFAVHLCVIFVLYPFLTYIQNFAIKRNPVRAVVFHF